MLPHTRAYDSSHHKVLRRERKDGPFPGDMDYLEFLRKLVDPDKSKTAFEQAVEIAVLVYEDVLSIHNQRTTRASRTRQALYCGLAEGVGQIVRANHAKQIGWDLLEHYELLEYSFEHIITKFQEEFVHLDDFELLLSASMARLKHAP